MTDLQALLAMLERAGIPHGHGTNAAGETTVKVENGGEYGSGYRGYYSYWTFHSDGRLGCVEHYQDWSPMP